ncbi:MAG: metallophosphoesterase family protein [Planctomycetota bacterium]
MQPASEQLVAIVSDIHGNRQALAACLSDAHEQGATAVWCLGDVVGYGARPGECLARLHEESALLIRGNHEQAVLSGPYGFNPVAAAAIDWTAAQLDAAALAALRALPERIDTATAVLVHGSPAQPLDEYLFPEDALDHLPRSRDYSPKLARSFRLIDRPCFVGHTHVPGVIGADLRWVEPTAQQGVYDTARRPCLINVGSVGQPRDGDRRASYALFDGERVRFRRIAYDWQAAADDIRATRALPEILAQRLAEAW